MGSASGNGTAKLRVLCLHGYYQNASIFREKTGSLRKLLRAHVEFDFLEAPHAAGAPVPPPGRVIEVTPEDVARINPKGWWFSRAESRFSSRDECDRDDGFQESVDAVAAAYRERGPFDGLLGFSQGAAMVHLLAALQQKGELPADIRFKFVILASGFLSLSSRHKELTDMTHIDLPSIQIFGASDEVVAVDRSRRLSSQFVTPVEIEHPGGHLVPNLSTFKATLVEFLQSVVAQGQRQ